ncbi:MAG: PAS domain S-box protein [Comamonadaceae bacterium]|nr:PAS domain S-box protein [Comamonadaceae bacterium]
MGDQDFAQSMASQAYKETLSEFVKVVDESLRVKSRTGVDAFQRNALAQSTVISQLAFFAEFLQDDLRVHQIELELQNEELCRTRSALEQALSYYFDLYHLAPIGFCTLNESGLILEANLSVARLLGVSRSALCGQALSRFVQKGDQDRYYQWLRQVLQGGPPELCELQMNSDAGVLFWVSLNSAASRPKGSKLTLRLVLADVTERKHTEAALQQAQLRLRNFTLRQQQEFDALRIELARDVHDQLGQTLAALKLEIDGIRAQVPEAAARMQAMILQGVASTRDISRALRPVALELGLIHALTTLVKEFSTRSNIRITTHLPPRLPVLSGSEERGLYRIAQEALTNAVLHAFATEVQLSVAVTPGRLSLQVSDDGQGFAPDAPAVSCGLGLLGMTERARQLGAKITIDSVSNHGTRVLLELRLTVPRRHSSKTSALLQ